MAVAQLKGKNKLKEEVMWLCRKEYMLLDGEGPESSRTESDWRMGGDYGTVEPKVREQVW